MKTIIYLVYYIIRMNYIFVNKNKRNTYKILCKYFKTNYFDFFVVNNLFNAKTFQIEQRLLYLILVMNQDLLLNKYNYRTYHKNISFLSGRTKAIITKYGISRTDFKKLMSLHQIPNLTKSSW